MTEFRAIHARDRGPIASALQQVPGYLDARQRLAALPSKINATLDSRHEVDQVIASALAAGEPLNTTEIRLAAAAAHNAVVGFVLVAESTERMRAQLNTELDSLVRENEDALFAALNTALQELITNTRELFEQLDGVTDFESAYKRGLASEYEALRAAHQEYRQIRSDQYLLTERLALGGVTIQGLMKTHVANLADVTVDIEHVLAELGVRVNDGNSTRQPKPSLPADWSKDAGFWWSLKHPDARTWVPNAAELDAARIRQAVQIKAAADWLGPTYFTNHRRGFDKSKFAELRTHLAAVGATARV